MERAQERPANTKAFSVPIEDLGGATRIEMYKKDPAYTQSKSMHDTCMMYAAAYADTMLLRLTEEQPDYFEEKGIAREEFLTHL